MARTRTSDTDNWEAGRPRGTRTRTSALILALRMARTRTSDWAIFFKAAPPPRTRTSDYIGGHFGNGSSSHACERIWAIAETARTRESAVGLHGIASCIAARTRTSAQAYPQYPVLAPERKISLLTPAIELECERMLPNTLLRT